MSEEIQYEVGCKVTCAVLGSTYDYVVLKVVSPTKLEVAHCRPDGTPITKDVEVITKRKDKKWRCGASKDVKYYVSRDKY